MFVLKRVEYQIQWVSKQLSTRCHHIWICPCCTSLLNLVNIKFRSFQSQLRCYFLPHLLQAYFTQITLSFTVALWVTNELMFTYSINIWLEKEVRNWSDPYVQAKCLYGIFSSYHDIWPTISVVWLPTIEWNSVIGSQKYQIEWSLWLAALFSSVNRSSCWNVLQSLSRKINSFWVNFLNILLIW